MGMRLRIKNALDSILGSDGDGYGCNVPMYEETYEEMLDELTAAVMVIVGRDD